MNSKNKVLCIGYVLLSLLLINIPAIFFPHYSQMQLPTDIDFTIHTSSDSNAFLSIWDTTRTSSGSSNRSQVRLPLQSDGTYNFKVDWGDGSNDTIMIWNQTAVTHNYAAQGIYPINITGNIIGWRFNNGGDRLKIVEIQQWGCLQLGNSGSYFYGCDNMELTATDNLYLTGTTNLFEAFRHCQNLGISGNINNWDVSKVTNMRQMFHAAFYFNLPIGNWDVSSVTNMFGMFMGVISFNQPIGDWDVSSVTNMYMMFAGATSFNQPLGTWNVSSVTIMYAMFFSASSFNQPLGTWNVSSVTTMESMFDLIALSTPNYDNLLLGWSQLTLRNNVIFDVGDSKYSYTALDARQSIIDNFSWSIHDAGLAIPEPFTLSSNAETSDTDGLFNLTWTSSNGANNYSVYSYSSYITEINGSLTSLTNETSDLTLPLSGYTDGLYYFITVAHNIYGDTLSNCISVRVGLIPGIFTLSSNAGNPDEDGIFDLNWLSSPYVNNYSIYSYSSYITEINGSLTSLTNETSDLTLPLSGYTDGLYYFITVAHNIYGDTLSNCISVRVGLIPGIFILSSNAGNPDEDGIFDLNWLSSPYANNYSIYSYSSYITEINGSLTSLTNETSDLTLPISGYADGTYYFITVAHNIYGDTFSNCISVRVGLIPGIFTLSSNAGNPDEDGIFDLNWLSSPYANNYSVYSYSSYITELNGSLTSLTNKTSDLTLPISGYTDGTYFFIVVAHNNYGNRFSNCIYVTVLRGTISPRIPGYNLYLIVCTLCVITIISIKRNMKKK